MSQNPTLCVIVSWRYGCCQAGIRKMLHLVWSKDNSSTSEDGKELKGIRQRLLECYKSLYFDPLPDMERNNKSTVLPRTWLSASEFQLTSWYFSKLLCQIDVRCYLGWTNEFGRDATYHDGGWSGTSWRRKQTLASLLWVRSYTKTRRILTIT